MQEKKSLITLENVRPTGIGQITSFTRSTDIMPGFLLGGTKGLFHIDTISARPARIRPNPVIYALSGPNGAIVYEEAKNHGQIAILDGSLAEKEVDSSLARTINPKAYWHNGLILLHKKHLVYFDLETRDRTPLVEFPPTRMVGQFERTGNGFEFMAILKDDKWPTYLYRLDVEPGMEASLTRLAASEDPVFARNFCRMADGTYLVIPQGISAFYIYRISERDENSEVDGPELRLWSLVPIEEEIHASGMLIEDKELYVSAADLVLTFRLK